LNDTFKSDHSLFAISNVYQYYFIKSHIDALTIMKRNEMKKDRIF